MDESTKPQESAKPPKPEASAAPDTYARLRAFEDKHLGKKVARPHGLIERGIGSPFAALDHTHKAHHAALEALIKAEDEHGKAEAAAAVAKVNLDAAHARLEAAAKAADEADAQAKKDEQEAAAEAKAVASGKPLPDPQAFAGTPHEQELARQQERRQQAAV